MKAGSKEKFLFILSLLIFNALAFILAALIELFFDDYLNPLLFSIIFFPIFTIIVIIIQSEGVWSRIAARSDDQDLSRWLAFTHRHSWLAILIAFVILSSYVALYLPERQVLIKGRVINSSDRSLEDLTLCLSTADGEAPTRLMVDEDGGYSIKADQADSFEINVLESGDNCSGADTLGASLVDLDEVNWFRRLFSFEVLFHDIYFYSTPASTVTIIPTDTPTASPTITPIPSPTPTITPSPTPPKHPCIPESEWESSWRGSGTFLNLPCYDFTDEGFAAVEEDGVFILEITHDPGEDLKRSIKHLFPLDSPKVWEVNISVSFMGVDIPAGEIADLFIGLGNPYAINGGTFIVYRYVNQPVEKPINVCIVNSAESECVDTGGDEGAADEFGNYHKFIADMAVGQTHQDIRIIVNDLDGAGYILIRGEQESRLRIRDIDQRHLFVGWRLTADGFVQASIDLNDELLSTEHP